MKHNSQLREDESRVAPNGDERAMLRDSSIDISCQSKLKKRKVNHVVPGYKRQANWREWRVEESSTHTHRQLISPVVSDTKPGRHEFH